MISNLLKLILTFSNNSQKNLYTNINILYEILTIQMCTNIIQGYDLVINEVDWKLWSRLKIMKLKVQITLKIKLLGNFF